MWINGYGILFVFLLLFPNLLLSIFHQEVFENAWYCPVFQVGEQIGRYGCMLFMIVMVSKELDFVCYVVSNGICLFLYNFIWFFMWNKKSLFKVLSLSILPTIQFFMSSLFCHSFILFIFSLVFGFFHITISYKNYIGCNLKENSVQS
ncbi:MAG: hypothetical protein ACI4UK_02755 [Floccifex sp.]